MVLAVLQNSVAQLPPHAIVVGVSRLFRERARVCDGCQSAVPTGQPYEN